MEFLVRWEIRLPTDTLSSDEIEAMRANERAHGTELWIRGLITRIWRVPGKRSVYVLWNVADANELHEEMIKIPFYPYMTVESVEPLGFHPAQERYINAAKAAATGEAASQG
jgi:muconolactone D-isomerase